MNSTPEKSVEQRKFIAILSINVSVLIGVSTLDLASDEQLRAAQVGKMPVQINCEPIARINCATQN